MARMLPTLLVLLSFYIIDPEIEAKLDALEREEEELIAKGFYETASEEVGLNDSCF